MGLRVLALAILASRASFGKRARRHPAAWVVRVQPGQVVNGSPVLFSVKPSKPLASLTANWLGNQVPFVLNPKDKTWYGLGGVTALKTKPGTYTLKLVGSSGQGAETAFEKHFSIGKGKYRKIAIKVSKRFTEPNPEQVRKITEDKATKQEAFSKSSAEREWSGKFAAPVDATISDMFGTQRTINGRVQSTHQGLDYAAGAGTPVAAVNAGTVLLAGPLYV